LFISFLNLVNICSFFFCVFNDIKNIQFGFEIRENLKMFNDRILFGDKHVNAPSSSLMDSLVNPKVKTLEGEGVGVCSLVHSALGVEGRAKVLGWD
jgi:hypothetical protein